jgi:hypothetical protein
VNQFTYYAWDGDFQRLTVWDGVLEIQKHRLAREILEIEIMRLGRSFLGYTRKTRAGEMQHVCAIKRVFVGAI